MVSKILIWKFFSEENNKKNVGSCGDNFGLEHFGFHYLMIYSETVVNFIWCCKRNDYMLEVLWKGWTLEF